MTDSASFTPLHWLHGMVSELEGLRTVMVQNISRQVGVPTRDDFEVQRGLLEDARDRLARLEAQLAALAAKFDDAAP